MKYLSFDIECCNGYDICEFGYVIFDENFRILKKDYLLINPKRKFKLRGREDNDDIVLAFSEEEYKNNPTYLERYETIKEIIETPNCQSVGFSIKSDIAYLNKANKLIKRPPFCIDGIDVQELFRIYKREDFQTNLGKIITELGIGDTIRFHRSDEDALATMLILKKLTEIVGLSIQDTCDYFEKIKNEMQAGKWPSDINEITSSKKQLKYINEHIGTLQSNQQADNILFKNKIVCIDAQYQQNNFRSYIKLIDLIYLNGATYSGWASKCDIFIYSDGSESDKRLYSAKQAAEEKGRTIIFLPLNQAINMLIDVNN